MKQTNPSSLNIDKHEKQRYRYVLNSLRFPIFHFILHPFTIYNLSLNPIYPILI